MAPHCISGVREGHFLSDAGLLTGGRARSADRSERYAWMTAYSEVMLPLLGQALYNFRIA